MVPSYSPKAAKALALLKRQYNDVDIFVEDTANHNMWLLIIRSMLPREIKIESVNMLGGRSSVEKACSLDQSNTGRKKLYIIDGDLDFLLGKRAKRLRYLYRIKANNIENLLMNEKSLVAIAMEYKPKKKEGEISSELNLSQSLAQLDRCLRPVFVAYAVAQKLRIECKTTSLSVMDLTTNTKLGPIINEKKAAARVISIYKKVVCMCGVEKARLEYLKIKHRSQNLPLSRVVSGKNYLLPIIKLQFQARFGYQGQNESFKVALARSFDPAMEKAFARAVAEIGA